MRGVSLEEITAATRISTRFLQALEAEQWDRLPGGVFNRGFVRAIAHFLGLDEENMVGEYALATSDQTSRATSPGSPLPSDKVRRPVSRRLPLMGLLVVVLAAAGWYAWHGSFSLRDNVQQARGSASGPTPQAVDSPLPASAAARWPVRSGAPTPTATALPQASSASAATLPAETADREMAAMELSVTAGRTTFVTVLADGRSVFGGRMVAGQNRRFRGQERFEVSARNSAALFLELNGQMMAPLGPPRRPGKVRLSRKNLKKTAGGLN